MEEVDNEVLLAAFQEKKKMMEEKMPKGSGSQRLFQQVPHQFCNAVCRVGFHRLYSTHNGRYRACLWGLSLGLVFRAAYLCTGKQASVDGCGEGSFTPELCQRRSLLEMVTLLSFLSFVCGLSLDVSMDSRSYGSGFSLLPVSVF